MLNAYENIHLPSICTFFLLPESPRQIFWCQPVKHCNSLSTIQGRRQTKSAKYVLFVCPNPWNGNLTQVGSRSFLGSWELHGIFKSLFVFTLENQALASAPLNPLLRTQRQRGGMLNVNGQTAPAPSEGEKDGGTRPDPWVFSYAVIRARSETVLTLPKVSISANCQRSSLADPDL